MTDGPPAAATSARFVNLPLSPSKAKTTILSSSWNPTYSMSDIVHPPSPSAVGHARPQQSSPLINVYFRARPADAVALKSSETIRATGPSPSRGQRRRLSAPPLFHGLGGICPL